MRRILAGLISVIMIFTALPLDAFAVQSDNVVIQNNSAKSTTEKPEVLKTEGGDEVTRLEWLTALTQTFEMTVEEDNYPDNYYSDISSEHENYYEIMLATEFGLVDVEAGGEFRPDDAATREFAAHTLNLCLGYTLEENTYTFSEKDSVTYKDDIQVAINKGWFTLNGSSFQPEKALTVTEKETLLEEAKNVYESTALDPEHENAWELADGVIDLTEEAIQVEMTGENQYTLTGCSYELKAGDVYAVMIDGIPLVKKVVGVKTEGEAYVVTAADVELAEAFKSLDIQGSAESDLTQTMLCSPDLEIEYIVGGTAEEKWQDGQSYDSIEALGSQEADAIIITKSMEIPDVVRKKYDIAKGVTADITCTVAKPDVEFDASIITRNPYAYVFVNTDVTFTCNVSMDVLEAMGVAPNIELAHIPLAFGLGYFKVNLEMTLKGNVTLTLVEYASVGVQFDSKSGFRAVKNFYKKAFTIKAHAEASVSLKATVGLNVLSILKANLYATVGAKAVMDAQTYDDGKLPHSCAHVNAWMFVTVGGSATFYYLIGSESWSFKEDIYHKGNSPVKVSFHYEDGVAVDRCTRTDGGTTNTTNANTSTGKWKYYTPANSRYGYNGKSSGTGSDGQPYTIFDYELTDEGKARITDYRGNVSALTIPDTLDGYEVAEIGSRTFQNDDQLRMVVIPDNVVEIGERAFENCSNLASVTLSKNIVELGSYAFGDCDKLTSIEIPKSLVGGDNVIFYGNSGPFTDCSALRNVSFEEGVTEICGNLFSECDGIEQIEIPDTVTKIQVQAFQNSGLKRIVIPNSVTKIGSNAFSGCKNLEEVIIPNSVVEINERAFSGCVNLSKVVLSKNISSLGSYAFNDCDKLTSIEIPKSLVGGDNVIFYGNSGPFTNCSALKNVSFEEGVTEICGNLFSECDGIEEIEIPDTVTKIQVQAFQNSGLKRIVIPNSVTKIGSNAFSGCKNLEEVIIPNSVVEINERAFSGCANLSKVVLSKNITSLGSYAFNDCDKLTSIEIPKSLVGGDNVIFYGNSGPFTNCSALKNVSFEEGVTEICGNLFSECDGIEEIKIPDTVTKIQVQAFQNSGLKRIVIPNSVTKIGNNAFSGCKNLVEVVIPNSVTKVGSNAFSGCENLNEVIIPNSVTEIGDNAFNNCRNLTKVELPNNLTKINEGVFKGCGKLEQVNFPQNLITIYSYAFDQCQALREIALPNSIREIYSNAFRNCDAITSIIIPDSVTYLGSNVFENCEALVDVKLGNGLTSIPSYAFNLCPSLEEIVIPYRVNTIKQNAFSSCTKLTKVTIPRATTTVGNNAFSYPTKLTIYGVAGTYAETYANSIGATFVNQEVKATAVTLSQKEITLNRGKTAELIMSVTPADFTDMVSWKSSNTDVATISDTGVVTAKGVGTTTIRLTVGNVSASCKVTVVQPVTSIYLNKSSLSLEGGQTYQLTASVNPSEAFDKTIKWSSSDDTIATVDENGLVTALKKGTATITVAAQDGSGITRTCTVTVTCDTHMCTKVEELESAHNYANNTTEVWCYTLAGAEELNITFDAKTNIEQDFDYLYVYDKDGKEVGKYTGTELAGKTITVTGDTVKLKLVTDDAGQEWGFKVTKIEKPAKNPFADVKENSWQFTYVKFAVENNLMAGKGKDAEGNIIFDPDKNMTRAEFVQTLYNKEGKPAVTYTDKFTDVPENAWFAKAIIWASDNGIVAGKGDKFDVNGNITREEVATILCKYATNYKQYDTSGRASLDAYEDKATISNWAVNNMSWAINYGVMKGRGALLAPRDNASRAECATMLKNFMDAYEK